MANQASVTTNISIQRDSLLRPLTSNDTITLTGTKGPTPGAVTAAVTFTKIDLSALSTPGLCRLQNLDKTNDVYVGIYSQHYNDFFPMLKLLAGKTQVVYLCDLLGRDMTVGTGTGPGDAFVNNLALKALNAPCQVLVEAFDV